MLTLRVLAIVLATGLVAAGQEPAPSGGSAVMMKALEAELNRALEKLKTAGDAPLYYLCYRVYETESVSVSATYGALDNVRRGDKGRELDVELRVGTPQLDNTHKIRDEGWDPSDRWGGGFSPMPVEEDEAAIRNALWMATDSEFKAAQKRYVKVKANKAVKVEEEDTSDAFSVEKPVTHSGPPVPFDIDRKAWETRLRKLSLIYRDFKDVQDSSFSFSAVRTRRWLVNSEGTRIQDERVQYRLFTVVATVADGTFLDVNDAAVTAHATAPSGRRVEVPLEWTLGQDGTYAGSFVAEEAGVYSVAAVARRGRDSTRSAPAPLLVDDHGADVAQAELRAPLLRRVDELGHLPGRDVVKPEFRMLAGVIRQVGVELLRPGAEQRVDVAILATVRVEFDENPIRPAGYCNRI